jgi:hypothetical protein
MRLGARRGGNYLRMGSVIGKMEGGLLVDVLEGR